MRVQSEHATLLHLPDRRGQYAVFTGSDTSFGFVGTEGIVKSRPSSPDFTRSRRPLFPFPFLVIAFKGVLGVVLKLQTERYYSTGHEQPEHHDYHAFLNWSSKSSSFEDLFRDSFRFSSSVTRPSASTVVEVSGDGGGAGGVLGVLFSVSVDIVLYLQRKIGELYRSVKLMT